MFGKLLYEEPIFVLRIVLFFGYLSPGVTIIWLCRYQVSLPFVSTYVNLSLLTRNSWSYLGVSRHQLKDIHTELIILYLLGRCHGVALLMCDCHELLLHWSNGNKKNTGRQGLPPVCCFVMFPRSKPPNLKLNYRLRVETSELGNILVPGYIIVKGVQTTHIFSGIVAGKKTRSPNVGSCWGAATSKSASQNRNTLTVQLKNQSRWRSSQINSQNMSILVL